MIPERAPVQYHLSDDQAQFRDVITAFLANRYDHDARMRIVSTPQRWSPDIWTAFARELGLLGLGLPEAAGGLGGGAVDHLLVMEAFGAALVVEPYLETCVIAAGVLARSASPRATAILEGIVAGSVRFAFAAEEPHTRYAVRNIAARAVRMTSCWSLSGAKTIVAGLPGASHVLLTARTDDGIALFVVDTTEPALALKPGKTIDGRCASELTFADLTVDDDACVVGPQDGAAALDLAVDKALAALCAEAVGIMRRLIGDTLAYLEQRKQFGTYLADFQVLQHRLADMHTGFETAQAMAYFAAGMVDAPEPQRRPAIAAAKAQVSTILRHVAQEAVQMHGAMGMTDELPIGHLFRRATVLENQLGSIDYHMGRIVRSGARL